MPGSRWFPFLYDHVFSKASRSAVGPFRSELLAEATGRVLEIGAGTGENLFHYRFSAGQGEASGGVRDLVVTDANPHMLKRLKRHATEHGLDIAMIHAASEQLPFASATFDAVVSTLVLCSVRDPAAALAEVHRVLKPDGRFLFLEHVKSEQPLLGAIQTVARPLFQLMTDGCHPDRANIAAMRAAGFEIAEMARRQSVFPESPLYSGVAKKE